MNKTRRLRYTLFGALFALVLAGLILHSYSLLVVCVITAIVLGIIGDRIENKPTNQFRKYNAIHEHKHIHKTSKN
jgi:hypothetical protein